MNKICYYLKYRTILILSGLMVFVSCAKEYPKNVDSPYETVLKSIKILNAGANGNTVIEGVIDENRKTVSFPRIDLATNFDAIRFQAEMSDGAVLDKENYQFVFGEGDAAKTNVVKVVNNDRFREYLVTLRLNIPVFGADFGKPEIHDNSINSIGNPIYPTFTSALTRGSGFDGEHVLIVTRHAMGSHLLKVSDLEQDNTTAIPLNLTGVAGGTFPVCAGAQVNGHTYVTNLSGNSAASPLKIYHWTNPNAEPQLIWADMIPGGGGRLGDNMSANLDANGNGYFYFGSNPSGFMGRLKVTNYTTVSDPLGFAASMPLGYNTSVNRVGSTSDYVYTGYEGPLRLSTDAGSITYSLTNTAVPVRGSDAHIITFNGERYLIMITAARTGSEPVVLYVYDITRGSTTREALELFDARSDKSPVYQYSLNGTATPNCFTQVQWHVKKDAQGKDDKLMIYAAHTDAGFVLVEFGKKVQTD